MSAVSVFCPHCGKELKLRDRGKLGRKGVCPSCEKMFVLRETQPAEEVELQLAADEPAVGTAARWVPDDPPSRPSPAPVAGRVAPPSVPAHDAVTPPLGFPSLGEAPSVKVRAAPSPFAVTAAEDDGLDTGHLARLKERKRRSAKRRNVAIALGGVTALLIGGGFWAAGAFTGGPAAHPGAPAAGQTNAIVATVGADGVSPAEDGRVGNPSLAAMPAVMPGATPDSIILPHQNLTRSQLQENAQLIAQAMPRRGEPIRLNMTPSGLNVVIHLRPAQLWSDDPVWQEVRYSLTEDVTNWIAAKLKEVCRRDPQQIEECLIGLRLGATGTDPEISAVIYLAQEEKLSDLIEEFRGQPLSEQGGPRVNISPPWAYLIKDTQTVAIVPEKDAAELPQFIELPNPNPTEGIYRLLDLSDNQRAFTVLFEVDDVKRHEGWLFSETTRPVFRRLLDWFGDDVETVCWSVDVQTDVATSDLLLRTRSVANSSRLASDTLMRLEYLPRDMQTASRKMTPATQGFQAIIGRFPAMLEAYRQATIPTVEPRHVRLTTVLPRKAAPNLALGTLLTWDQSLHTDFSRTGPAPAAIASAQPAVPISVPDKVVDRLNLKFAAEFKDVPLQEALAYIADECKITIDLDGNAMKDAGFTQNMKQKFDLGQASGLDALREIAKVNKPETPAKRMCLVIDEASKMVTLTTESFAKDQGKTVFPLGP